MSVPPSWSWAEKGAELPLHWGDCWWPVWRTAGEFCLSNQNVSFITFIYDLIFEDIVWLNLCMTTMGNARRKTATLIMRQKSERRWAGRMCRIAHFRIFEVWRRLHSFCPFIFSADKITRSKPCTWSALLQAWGWGTVERLETQTLSFLSLHWQVCST
jgi:hypothetical protein